MAGSSYTPVVPPLHTEGVPEAPRWCAGVGRQSEPCETVRGALQGALVPGSGDLSPQVLEEPGAEGQPSCVPCTFGLSALHLSGIHSDHLI